MIIYTCDRCGKQLDKSYRARISYSGNCEGDFCKDCFDSFKQWLENDISNNTETPVTQIFTPTDVVVINYYTDEGAKVSRFIAQTEQEIIEGIQMLHWRENHIVGNPHFDIVTVCREYTYDVSSLNTLICGTNKESDEQYV